MNIGQKAKRLLAAITVSVVIGSMAGCASSSKEVKPSTAIPVLVGKVFSETLMHPDSDRRVPVTVVRDKGMVGVFVHTVLLVDRQEVAIMDRKQKVDLYLTPGDHIFTVTYPKHMHGRPLGESVLAVDEHAPNLFRIRLVLKDAPRVEAYGQPPIATGKPRWHDREDLEQYAAPDDVANIVDAAIAHATTWDWLKDQSGRGMNEETRYVYTRKAGWVDLKHVISTASNPGCYIPGASVLGGYDVEMMQVFTAPFSAFEPEDLLGNRIGANAALLHAATFGLAGTRGHIVQRAINKLDPMTLAEAAAHFHVSIPIKPWPFDPREVGAVEDVEPSRSP